MGGRVSGVNAYFQPRTSDIFSPLVTFGTGAASLFERERGGEGLQQATSTNGWASKPLTSVLSPWLRREARKV
jgi:hypothetical protein